MATRFEEIQIEQIRPNPKNIRDEEFADDPEMEKLTLEVKTMGVYTPVRVYPHPDIEGDYILQDGHRRRLASIRAGKSSMPCQIVDAPKRGAVEDLDIMLTTGSNAKPLSESERNKGIQGLLDLGKHITTVGKRYGMSRSEIKTRTKLVDAPEPIKKRFDSGALDLVAVAKIQELEEKGAAGLLDTVIEQLESTRATSANPQHLNATIARAEVEHVAKLKVDQLVGFGAIKAPNDANYSGQYKRVKEDLSIREHLEAKHEYSHGRYEEKTTWYVKTKAPKADPVTDSEKAEKQKQRHLNGLLGIAFRARQSFLAERIRSKEGVPVEADFEILWGYIRSDVMRLAPEFLADVTGIGYPEGASNGYGEGGYQLHKQWEERVEKRLQTFSWRQIIRLASLFGTKDTDKQLRFAKSFERKGEDSAYAWSSRFRWLEKVQRIFGYELDSAEVEALEWAKDAAGKDRKKEYDLDTVTEACRDCRQSVIGGEGWDGRCGECADRAEAKAEDL